MAMYGRSRTFFAAMLVAATFAPGCTRTEIISADHVEINISLGGFSGTIALPPQDAFDNIGAAVSGFDWEVIATLHARVVGGRAILNLPDELPAHRLCKVGRDGYSDFEGFWPAESVSDRTAKVAGLGDIIAYRGDIPIGRLVLTDWDGTSDGVRSAAILNFHYADRPFSLSGYNLTRPGKQKSFRYDASFLPGWNAYANVNQGSAPALCTTDVSEIAPRLWWMFEKW